MHLPKNGLPRVLGSLPVCLSQADEALPPLLPKPQQKTGLPDVLVEHHFAKA